jgi:type II secretory pathway component PulF
VREIVVDVGTIPYLTALRGLYAAGVPLRDAHERAASTAPVGGVRHRLGRATELLQRERRSLADALAASAAVDAETLELVRRGEQTGELEADLLRAVQRRRDTLARRLSAAVRWTGAIGYGAVVVLVLWIVTDFYGNLLAGLHR